MKLTLQQLRAIWSGKGALTLDAADYKRIEDSAAAVQRALATGAALYGINTGFGKLASKRINDADLAQLQRNLVLSHAVGVGPELDERVVRLAMAIKIVTLAAGRSGVRRVVVDTLAKLQEAANAARLASQESEAAADRYTAQIEKRLGALASVAGSKKVVAQKPVERVVERKPEPVIANEELTTLHAAASAAVARGGSRPRVEMRTQVAETQPKRSFKGFGSWGNFMPPREDAPTAANEGAFDLADFGSAPPVNPDAELKTRAIDLGAGFGMHAIPLARAGAASVTRIS